MSTPRRHALLLGAFLAVSTPASAQTAAECRSTESAQQCVNRLMLGTVPAGPVAAGAVAGSDFGRDFSSAFTNFLKVFGTQLEVANVREGTGNVSAQYALELWGGRSALLQANIRRPVLGQDVQSAVAGTSGTTIDALRSTLGDFDDTQLGFDTELVGSQRTLKRDVESVLYFAFKTEVAPDLASVATTLQKECGLEKTLGDCPAVKAKLEAAVAGADRSIPSAVARGFSRMFETLSQLTLAGTYTIRDPLVGRDEARVDLTWEQVLGGRRVGRGCRKGTRVDQVDEEACKALLQDLASAASAPTSDGIGRASLGASLSYSWPDDASVSGIRITRPRAYSLSAVAKWNKIVMRQSGGSAEPALRLDGTLSVDVTRKDGEEETRRLLGTATLGIRLSDSLTLPVGVRYASRPADLGEVDAKWSAHVGFNFRLPESANGAP